MNPTPPDDQPTPEGFPDADMDLLGAPATLSKAASEGREPSTRSRSRRTSGGTGSRVLIGAVAVLVLAFAAVPVLGTSLKKTPRDRVGISYGGGPIEGSHFQRIVQPGSALFFNGILDPLYLYPADQQNYIISKTPGEGGAKADSVIAPSKDRVAITYQVAVYYKLNTDKLRQFHEQLGLKYKGYTRSGWQNLIRDTFRQQIENALQQETRRHLVSDIYGDADLLVEIQDAVQTTLSARLKLAVGQAFFCSPTWEPGQECTDPIFVIKRADIPRSVALAYEANRISEVQILTKQNEVRQREAEAQGIQALASALEQAGPAYTMLKAIESGKVTFWVVPQDGGGITVATNGTGAAPATPASPGG